MLKSMAYYAAGAVVMSVCLMQTEAYRGVTWNDIQTLSTQMNQMMLNAEEPGEGGEFLLAQLVRLSFHDCVGGCDGCLNLNHPDNAGLDVPLGYLEDLYLNETFAWFDVMSRADFWSMAGAIASNRAARIAGEEYIPEFEWFYGRVDCPTAPLTDQNMSFPSAHLKTRGLLGYFSDTFNFNARETVAIMGAHTLGRARNGNSGFSGVWVTTPVDDRQKDKLNNRFFVDLLDNSKFQWQQTSLGNENAGTIRYMWTYGNESLPSTGFMLNSDMSIIKKLRGLNADTGLAGCAYDECRDAGNSLRWAQSYAADNTLWLMDFEDAFIKMTAWPHDLEDAGTLCLVEVTESSTDETFLASC